MNVNQSILNSTPSTPPSSPERTPVSTSIDEESSVGVYDPEYFWLYQIPRNKIAQIPGDQWKLTRYALCNKFNSEEGCKRGKYCKFVHAFVDETVPKQSVHVNYAYQDTENCPYPRHTAADPPFRVLLPNEVAPIFEIPADQVLVTRGSTSAQTTSTVVSHCAHFYLSRLCNRGRDCGFVHCVYIDPSVTKKNAKAPPPSVRGITHLGNNCTNTHKRATENKAAASRNHVPIPPYNFGPMSCATAQSPFMSHLNSLNPQFMMMPLPGTMPSSIFPQRGVVVFCPMQVPSGPQYAMM
jgi:hypothetical protein